MKDYLLATVSHSLSPFWMNSHYGKSLESVVDENGHIDAFGEKLRFYEESLPTGTQVYVNLGRRFTCITMGDRRTELAEEEKRKEAYRQAEQKREEDRRARMNRHRAEAEAFNATLQLPVKWDVGIKDVLSGLSANSNGDGRSRSTVEHILLLEDLTDGRLKRSAHDFLCSAGGKNGKNWTGQKPERFTDGEGKEYVPKVSCKKCLEIAARWQAEVQQTPPAEH